MLLSDVGSRRISIKKYESDDLSWRGVRGAGQGADEESVHWPRRNAKEERNISALTESLKITNLCLVQVNEKIVVAKNQENNQTPQIRENRQPALLATGDELLPVSPTCVTNLTILSISNPVCLKSGSIWEHDYGRKFLSYYIIFEDSDLKYLCISPSNKFYGGNERVIWPRTWQPEQEPVE